MTNSMAMRFPLGLALLSGTGLLLEISLTRLFSTIYYPSYVYILLALAVLGVGLGAAGVAAWSRLRQSSLLPYYALLAALGATAVTWVALRWPQSQFQALHLVLAVVPFVGIGLAVATLFSLRAAASPRLYAADLIGAGGGALLALPLIDAVELPAALLIAAVGFGLTAIILSAGRSLPAWLVLAATTMLFVGTLGRGWITLDVAKLAGGKPLTERLESGGTIIATRWDSFARTDLLDPGQGRPYELYMDGAAGSVMPPASDSAALWRDIGFFPFATEQPARVFVIGPGGGLDVWFGLQSNAGRIDGAEVNRASLALARAYGSYNDDLYDRPEVAISIDEGRSVLTRSGATYDLIFLSHVVTLTAERSGLALVENSAFTTEAFATYLEHLTPTGMLAVKLYDEPTLTRALGTALAVLGERGLSDAAALQHVIALVDGRAEPPVPLLMVRNTPFTREDVLSIGAVAREVGFTPLFLPGVYAQTPLVAVASGDAAFGTVIAASAYNIAPVTDNRPFFFHFEPGLPAGLVRLLLGLLIVVAAGTMATAIYVHRVSPAPALRWAPLYFAALGAAFMLVEIALIQQTRLLLGHPSRTVATVLGTLLIGGGLGSALFGGLASVRGQAPHRVALGGAILGVVLWAALWPSLQQVAASAPGGLRILLVVAAVAPLAFCMGAPFPLGLRSAGAADGRLVALAWAINGVMSVAGAAAGLAMAMLSGYQALLWMGAGLYGVALLAGRWVTARNEPDGAPTMGR